MRDLSCLILWTLVVLCSTQCWTVSALNQATCDALDSLSSGTVTCSKNAACNSTECTTTLLSGYSLTLDLLSCRTPPGVHMILRQGSSSVYNQVVDSSVSGINVGIGTLSITLDQLTNAIGLRITLSTFFGDTDIIPYTTIPLDTQSCITPTTEPPPTTNVPSNSTTLPPSNSTVPPTPATDGPNPATCQGLDQLTTNVMQMTCTRNQDCNQANCTITNPSFSGNTLSMTLLPCREPRPGVRLIARDPSGDLLLDRVVDESINGIELTSNTLLDVTLIQLNNSIGIAANVRADIGITTIEIPILSYTVIPLDKRACTSDTTDSYPLTTAPTDPSPTTRATESPSTTAVNLSTEPTPSPTQAPLPPTTGPTIDSTTDSKPNEEKNTTCSVLAQLAQNAEFFMCTADSSKPCNTVHCSSTLGYAAVIVLLPCQSPAAIRLVITQEEEVILNRTVDHSEVIPVPALFGLVLNVSIDHYDDAMGLQIVGTGFGQTINVVKYTVIPLERAKTCNVVTGKPSEAESSDSSSAIFTPLHWLLLLLLSFIALLPL